MRSLTWPALIAGAAVAVAVAAATGAAPGFRDPVDTAAAPAARPTATPMAAVARAGDRFVAVGLRGTVIVSDAAGGNWRQAAVPVGTDLVAVHFATPQVGWACGHDGVVLRSDDGGLHWRKQLDGRALEALLRAPWAQRAAAGDAAARQMLGEIDRDYENGTQQPLLSLWFADERNGFAVGSFGILVATHDGGATWQSWMDRIDNPELLHLFAVGAAGDSVAIASEKGTVFRLDAAAQRFVAQRTGYAGSLFGFVAGRDALVAFGLRGTALRTRDGGASWQKMDSGVATGLNGGAANPSGGVLLASQGGQLLAGEDPAQRLRVVPGVNAMPLSAVAVNGRTVVVAGLGGVQTVRLP